MLIAISDIPAEDVVAGRTRISRDHSLARLHPGAFVPAENGPPSGMRTRVVLKDRGARQARELSADEKRRMSARICEIDSADRRDPHRFERSEDREKRLFWEQSERMLAQLREPEQRTPAIYDLDYLLSEEQEAELRRIDEDWGGERAPWN